MKVVLFCGGLGMRLRDYSEIVPKPLVKIGTMPILWHVMKYYAWYGHTDFMLCLGYQGEAIKNYFLNYNECISNDFILSNGGKNIELLSNDIQNWRIQFVTTGMHANIAQRLGAVEPFLKGEDEFLANYCDGLTDLHLPDLIDYFHKKGKIATFLSVRPNLTYHFVSTKNGGIVTGLHDIQGSNIRINGGYYVFKKDIFRYLSSGRELVEEPFQRLIKEEQLTAYVYDKFWACMDTFKDKQTLEDIYASGNVPWEVWKTSPKAPKANYLRKVLRTA
ncbi:MAG: sugar phosphate nucleotidyltransferase [Alphaproteobacteria bacterium]